MSSKGEIKVLSHYATKASDGYKEVPAGRIPEDWKYGSISDIAEINPSTDTSKITGDDYVSFLPMEAVSNSGKIINMQARRYFEVKNGYTSFINGDVLFAKITPCMENGKGALANGLVNNIGFGSTEFHVIRPRLSASSEYIYYVTISSAFRRTAGNYMTGSAGQQRVPTVFLYLHKIPIPTIIEQQKIVTILGTLDALIEKTDRIITRSEELKKGLIYELLTKGIRHTEFEEKELGILPKEWKCVSLVEISLSYKNGIYKLDKYYGSGHPCIRMYNIANGKVNKNNSPLLNVTDAELKEYGLVEGDLLINRVNSRDLVGKAGIVPPGLGSVTFESKNIRVRFNRSKIIPEYMGIYVQMKSYLNQVNKYVKSAISQATINQDDIDDILVPLPSVDEQKEIVTIISGLDDKINNEMRCLEHLLSIKKALMQDLLTGRVRVKPDPSPPEAAPHV